MTRLKLAAPATIEARPARILLSGPPGADLALEAMTIAEGLIGELPASGRFLFIDTENRTALRYADDFTFDHVPWVAPYNPAELAADVLAAGDTWPVIVIDSVHRWWTDEGGVRDIADGVGRPGKPSGWTAARPAHRALIKAIQETAAHVIVCCRPRTESVLELDPDTGRATSRLVAGDLVSDSMLAVDLDVWVTAEADHRVLAVRASRVPTIRNGGSWEADQFAGVYFDWCQTGEPPITPDEAGALTAALELLPDDNGLRLRAKVAFFESFGRPRHLRASQVPAARELIAGFEAEGNAKDPAARANEIADRVAADRAGARAGKDAATGDEEPGDGPYD